MATRLAPARQTRALRPEPTPAERRHLRVVPPNYVSARTRQRRARLAVFATGAAIAAALFGVVAFHVVLTQNELDIQHLRSQSDAALVKQQQLRLQAAELESPERVVDDAQKLGMVPPATVRYLSPDGSSPAATKPATTPTPTTAPARPTPAKAYTSKPAATTAPPVTAAPSKSTATTAKVAATPVRPAR